MTQKILTIVIPTFNMERLLTNCLDSIIINDKELICLLEVLVINDGSTDRSSEIVQRYQQKYPQIFRLINKENGNYGSCINRGLKEATGKYIKILDADDQLEKEVLKKIVKKLLEMDVDLVITNYKTINEQGEETGKYFFNLPQDQIIPAENLVDIGRYMAMHAVIYKTDNLKKINYSQTEGISYTDQEWIFTPMQTVKRFVYFDEYLYLYLIGRQGQTMNIASLARNMDQNLIVISKNLDQYNTLKENIPTKKYLWVKLTSYLEYIYTQYLFNTSVMNVTPLIKFDKELRQKSPSLYYFSNSLKAGKLPFVRVWRIFHYKKDYGLNRFFAYRKYRMGF